MSKLQNILDEIDKIDASSFNYNRDYDEVIRQLNELSFIAEIDHNNIYLSILEQIFVKDEETNDWHLYSLNDEQRDEYYRTHELKDYPNGFRIADSLHIYINSKERYVQVFNSRNIIKKLGSPKDDYGKVYTVFNKESEKRTLFERAEFKLDQLSSDDEKQKEAKETYDKLIQVCEFSKTSTIDLEQFDFKVHQDMSRFWGHIEQDKSIVDYDKLETERPESLEPKKPGHSHYDIDRDIPLKRVLVGNGYDEIDYEKNGWVKSFNNLKEAEGAFYSIIDYVNARKIPARVYPDRLPPTIKGLEKHYLNGKWPIAESEAEADALKKELTKFLVKTTKFKDMVAVELEVWEMGLVYIITNVWNRQTVDAHNAE